MKKTLFNKDEIENLAIPLMSRQILETVPAMIVVYSIKTGKYIYVNGAVKKMLGYTPEEFIKGGFKFVSRLVHPDDAMRIMEQNMKALEKANKQRYPAPHEEIIEEFEFRIRHKNGSWRWLHTDASVFKRAADGSVEYVLNASLDITGRKEAEDQSYESSHNLEAKIAERTKELEVANRRANHILESITDGFLMINNQWIYTYINYQAEKVLGKQRKDLLGKDMRKVHPGFKNTIFFHKYNEAMITRKPNAFEAFSTLLERWLQVHVYPSKEGLAIYTSDLTARKHAEEAMRKNETVLRSLVESNIMGIIICDLKGQIYEANEKFLSMFGFTRQDLTKHKLRWDTMTPPEFQAADVAAIIELKKHRRMTPWEKEYFNKEGKRIPVLIGGATIDDKGTTICFVLDISERKQLERHKDEFIGIASHELKTPVTSIKAYAQVLEKRFAKAGDVASAQLLEKMNSQIDRLTNLIGDLLDATRIDGGKLQFRIGRFNFDELIHEVVEEMQRTTIAYTLHIRGRTGKHIVADRDRTGQVVTNILSNAIKYSSKGKDIHVHLRVVKNGVKVCVQDFGVGIPKDRLQKVFERFYRVSGPGQETIPGLGLGLFISAEIIRRQGGKIWVESEEGKGSIFCFTLPVRLRKARK